MANRKLKIGLHDFLNAQPLLQPLQEKRQALGLSVVTGPPADLAVQLQEGKLDLAMIPSIEYLRDMEDYRLLPGVAIASRGPVDTVLLAARCSLDQVASIALDNRSRTSVALLEILFGETFPWNIFYDRVAPDPAAMLEKHDAALIIGDLAFGLKTLYPDLQFYDLSERWLELTGKAFVHAVVAVREEVVLDHDFLVVFQEAKAEGLARLEDIARAHSERLGISPDAGLDYLSRKIIYDLGKPELEGLQTFRDLCFQKGIIEQKGRIRFVS
ncbi:MAG: hypothetical protein GWM98_18410 [Nitrospinaceae bacterium]|nr:menaquinone biosynthesis protein [Nitrospinaceae bacterium]NIR56103.1 menaquinone biosynthesis protein [Nitrospinaceae bacterium]NIS86551.1 menaquinone biosynthesis protein [Nitrospinaceae bacterium]NIT83385.1 menaquinone biosynthesis protein [Nitrospinaceae bacterium]NIU45595.1 menaquinone biosynthesis protein [Nitrospinaceae bacterium]